jgi:hypothetical protein
VSGGAEGTVVKRRTIEEELEDVTLFADLLREARA